MARSRIEQIVRQFRENGLKLLLERPANAQELLALTATRLVDRLDFSHMKVDPTTYIAADYRHVAADVVLQVPFRNGNGRETITVYVLIEHQSEPDNLMCLRVLDYVVQIYKRQVRELLGRNDSRRAMRLDPVLPVVLYTGTKSWPRLPALAELVKQGELFGDAIPQMGPLFVNLPDVPPHRLEASGPLGHVLELIQRRRAQPEEFQALVAHVVARLEKSSARQRERWLELLSYAQALVYHDREEAERDGLRQIILSSVRTDARRKEVEAMTRTIAEALKEEGREEGREQGREQGREEGREEGAVRALQQALLDLMRDKFRQIPRGIEKAIRATPDQDQLRAWLVRAGQATTVQAIGIVPPSRSR